MKHSSSFNFDLKFAEIAEDWAKLLFKKDSEYKIEVKSDRATKDTGNMFIEVYSRGVKSGISTTEANYWVYLTDSDDAFMIFSTERLKVLVRKYYELNGYVKGGDNNTSLGVLIPVDELYLEKKRETFSKKIKGFIGGLSKWK